MTKDAQAIIDLYRRHADAWVEIRSRHLFEQPWLDRFLALLPGSPSVLDIGCGSGDPIGRYLSQHAALTGIDTSPELLAIARAHIPAATWQLADMRSLDLHTTFDGLLAWNSSFHLTPDDQRALFPVLRRHAAPGAALMFTSGTSLGAAIGTFQGEPLYHGSLDPDEYRTLLNANGFEVVDHVVEGQPGSQHAVWLAQLAHP